MRQKPEIMNIRSYCHLPDLEFKQLPERMEGLFSQRRGKG
jgi:hypothetical protein